MKCALVLLGPIYMENTCLVPGRRITRLPRWVKFFLHFLTKLSLRGRRWKGKGKGEFGRARERVGRAREKGKERLHGRYCFLQTASNLICKDKLSLAHAQIPASPSPFNAGHAGWTKLEEPFTSETKSWLGLKGDLPSRVNLRQVFFTVHIPQVRIQVTMLKINKQAQKCLPALNVIQNVVFDGGEITYNYVVIFGVTCGIWPVK